MQGNNKNERSPQGAAAPKDEVQSGKGDVAPEPASPDGKDGQAAEQPRKEARSPRPEVVRDPAFVPTSGQFFAHDKRGERGVRAPLDR